MFIGPYYGERRQKVDAGEYSVPPRIFVPDDEQRHICGRDGHHAAEDELCLLAKRLACLHVCMCGCVTVFLAFLVI